MGGWPVSKNRQWLPSMVMGFCHTIRALEGFAMHPDFAPDPITPYYWSAPNHAEYNGVPDGFSIVQTAQPGVQPVLTREAGPGYTDRYQYEYHPVTLYTNYLVENPQPKPPHQNMLWLQHARIPFDPDYYEEMMRLRLKARYESSTRAKFKKLATQQRAPTNAKAFADRAVSGGAYNNFAERPPVGKVPFSLTGDATSVARPSVSQLKESVRDGEKHEVRPQSNVPTTINKQQNGNEVASTAGNEGLKSESGRKHDPTLGERTSPAQEKDQPEGASEQLDQNDGPSDVPAALHQNSEVSSSELRLNEFEKSRNEMTGLKMPGNISTLAKESKLENEKLPTPGISNSADTDSIASEKTVAHLGEHTASTNTEFPKVSAHTSEKIELAKNQETPSHPDASFESGNRNVEKQPHELGSSNEMAMSNNLNGMGEKDLLEGKNEAQSTEVKDEIVSNDSTKPDHLTPPNNDLSKYQKAVVAPEVTYKNALLKTYPAPTNYKLENKQISKMKTTEAAKQNKKIDLSPGPPNHQRYILAPKSNQGVSSNAWAKNHSTKARKGTPIPSDTQKSPYVPKRAENDQVALSGPDHDIGHGSDRNSWIKHRNVAEADLGSKGPEDVVFQELKRAYADVLKSKIPVNHNLSPEEDKNIDSRIFHPEHSAGPSAPEDKGIKPGENNGSDPKPIQNGDEANEQVQQSELEKSNESEESADLKTSKRKKKKKKKKNSKGAVDADWELLNALELEREKAKSSSTTERANVKKRDWKEDSSHELLTEEQLQEQTSSLDSPRDMIAYFGPYFRYLGPE
ncbi:hypothetical protein Pst134EB_017035 [Puccinia striiformis f. sp. tritici]|nr:hypothetical protein Pst134EB_017035 [Puccinia striiformis f. sp. tritici]